MLEFAPDLPSSVDISNPQELTIRVNNDVALTAFFQAMSVYFACEANPPEMLLKLKLKELLASIVVGNNNPELSAYFRFIASSDGPGIPAIMERNFCHNLPIEVFAKMCNRSVSSFKRDFQKIYGISPGRWLLERRLKHSASLLQNTALSVTGAALECGFEDTSHFSKAFKEKFGMTPTAYRDMYLTAAY
jgi:AraC-like DNA-binding protein